MDRDCVESGCTYFLPSFEELDLGLPHALTIDIHDVGVGLVVCDDTLEVPPFEVDFVSVQAG